MKMKILQKLQKFILIPSRLATKNSNRFYESVQTSKISCQSIVIALWTVNFSIKGSLPGHIFIYASIPFIWLFHNPFVSLFRTRLKTNFNPWHSWPKIRLKNMRNWLIPFMTATLWNILNKFWSNHRKHKWWETA